MKKYLILLLTLVVIFCSEINVLAEPLSIFEIQYTTDVNGNSDLNGNIVDCLGGIVTHKRGGGRPRLVVQDPNYPDGWSAIQVKPSTYYVIFLVMRQNSVMRLTPS